MMVFPLIVAANEFTLPFGSKTAPAIEFPVICALIKAVEGPLSVTMQLPDASWRSDLSFEIVAEPPFLRHFTAMFRPCMR